MKNFLKKIGSIIIPLLSVFGININISNADTPKYIAEIKENSPLYLEHASNIFQQNMENNPILTWHYSHYSHESHYSHYSHESHYSHYSSRW